MTIEEKPAEIGGRLEDFEVLQVLGKGAYGFVAKVKSKLNFKNIRFKKIRIFSFEKRRYVKILCKRKYFHAKFKPSKCAETS
jgi:hypothetical protein